LVIVLGVVVRQPVLGGALISDDWDHYAMVRGVYPVARAPFDMFKVIAGTEADRVALARTGRLPWWSDPDVRISFLRPLASLASYAEYAWLGADRVPARGHWHSLLWWSLCVVAAAGVLARVLPRAVALLACALFAVDDAFALPVAWSASRAELIACALTIAALWAHIAWTERPSLRLRALAVGLMCLATLAGEYALALFAYVGAYALLGARGSMRQRLSGLAPLALPVVAYLVVHAAAGYGATDSAFYNDPFRDLRYLRELPARTTLLLGDALFGYTAEWWFGHPWWWPQLSQSSLPVAVWLVRVGHHALQLVVGGAALVLVLGGLVHVWRAWRAQNDPLAEPLRWLLLGALASLPALCGTFPMTRLTVAPALGLAAWLAAITLRAVARVRSSGPLAPRAAAAALACAIVGLHGLAVAQHSRIASVVYAAWARSEQAWVERAPLDDPNVAARHVFVVSANDNATQFSLPFIRHRQGKPMPLSCTLLLPPTDAAIGLTRIAPNALELRSSAAGGLSGLRHSAYRLATDEFRAGQLFATPRFTVEVLTLAAGTPTALRFVFATPLDDPSYIFLYPRPEGLSRLDLPPPGGTIQLQPPADPPFVPEP
jgi:hypothetical protein